MSFFQRYSRETPFTALNVDVRNHHTLIDSLEQYVKGDLLEGANAYHCERCDKKVSTPNDSVANYNADYVIMYQASLCYAVICCAIQCNTRPYYAVIFAVL